MSPDVHGLVVEHEQGLGYLAERIVADAISSFYIVIVLEEWLGFLKSADVLRFGRWVHVWIEWRMLYYILIDRN